MNRGAYLRAGAALMAVSALGLILILKYGNPEFGLDGNDETSMSLTGGLCFGFFFLFLFGWVLLSDGMKTDYYCADCGNYIGVEPTSCARCGCNRYTTQDPGVGVTVKGR